jgi:phage/plasmid-like protein (TIGR03299 family)
MAHEIAIINGKEAMAYTGKTPWHELGTEIAEGMDVPAALEAANLNWDVKLRPMYYRQGKNLVKVPTRRVVIRDVDNMQLGVVGTDYEPVQNSEAFSILQPACEQFGVTIETAGALGIGDRVWMLAKLPDSNEAVKGDVIDGYFLVTTGHMRWTSLTARPTPIRVVCANTLAVAQSMGTDLVRLRHTVTEKERLNEVSRMVTTIVEQLATTSKLYGQLASRSMTPDELFLYVSQVLGIDGLPKDEVQPTADRRRDTILHLAKHGKGVEYAPETAWTAYNAITEYVDHVRPTEAHNAKTIADATQAAIFGAGAKLKSKALHIAQTLIN